MDTGFSELFKLGLAERLRLVESLWDSIAQDVGPLPVSAAKIDELQARAARYQTDPAGGLTWEQVISQVHRGRE
jgi:putative addiction module component (TIGR02574 family)